MAIHQHPINKKFVCVDEYTTDKNYLLIGIYYTSLDRDILSWLCFDKQLQPSRNTTSSINAA
jgi:hypothetical protein